MAVGGDDAARPGPTEEGKSGKVERAEAGEAEALAKYNELRDKTPKTAEAQWKLAQWCEQHALKAEALVHLSNVVKLDPGRAAAWKKLGFTRRDGRWVSDEQRAEADAQAKADRAWGPRLQALHKRYHKAKTRGEAEAALTQVEDPRAVPSVYREFCGRSATDQVIAVQLLGQIRSPESTRTLAILSVYGVSAEVRRKATETLRGREPSEYLPLLVSLLADIMKYEVRPVGGPGSPGVLFVEGQRFNVQRVYAPPPPPNVSLRPGDMITYDESGMPAILRPGPTILSNIVTPTLGAKGTPPLSLKSGTLLSPSQLAMQAQTGAQAAQAELANDVAQIEAVNSARKSFNSLVLSVAQDASGQNLGEDPAAWKDWVAKQKASQPEPTKPKPTLEQLVPFAVAFGQTAFYFSRVPDH
jgi:hypothetical protein